jgi:hypothetical protein
MFLCGPWIAIIEEFGEEREPIDFVAINRGVGEYLFVKLFVTEGRRFH